MAILLIGVAIFLAFGNGANDNFKGFATVWGAQLLTYRRALAFATVATLAGSIASLMMANALIGQFSGRGLVPDAVASAPAFMLHAGLGAALTVIAATRTGLPVSTTHALIGGLVGAGFAQVGSELQFGKLAGLFLLPLLLSPLLAAGLGMLLSRPRPVPVLITVEGPNSGRQPGVIGRFADARLAEAAHVLSAASICFARGVNDTPKLAALLLASQLIDAAWSVPVIAGAMVAGGLVYARRVAETMSRRVTRMDNTQGLTANLITAALVLFASKLGLPVSTTHVSVGSIAGVGATAGTLDWTTVRTIGLAWMATLPLAAGLAWIAAQCF